MKPGWKTTEFWFSRIASLLSLAYALGWIGDAGVSGKVAAIAAFGLTEFGYTVSRGIAKNANAQVSSSSSSGLAVSPSNGDKPQ